MGNENVNRYGEWIFIEGVESGNIQEFIEISSALDQVGVTLLHASSGLEEGNTQDVAYFISVAEKQIGDAMDRLNDLVVNMSTAKH